MPNHPRARPRPDCPTAGVTLVELMIVVLLIGVLTGLAMPRTDLDVYRMRAAAQGVGTTLLAAQRLAVTRQHDVVVAIDVAGARLRIHEDANNDGQIDAGEAVRFVPLPDGTLFGRGGTPAYLTFGESIAVSGRQGGLPALTFRRNGSASEEAAFYLTSRRAAQTGGYLHHTRVVHVARSTGRASWLQWSSNQWRREF